MKCTACKFWQKSKMHGNHCICTGAKPCDRERNRKVEEHYKKRDRRRKRWK